MLVAYRICRIALGTGLALLAVVPIGCGPHTVAARSPAPQVVRVRAVSTPATSSTVQAMPEYETARTACRHGQYQQAAAILARLEKTPSLTHDERAFIQTQQQICLGHLAPHPGAAPASPSHPLTPSVPQSADCGPRALLLACAKLGIHTDLAALTKAAGTGAKGTSLEGLKRAAESVHLKAEGVQVSREALPDQPIPSVCWFHGDHYVCMLALNGRGESGTALIHDPNDTAPKTVSQESLLQSSAGVLLTLRR